MSMIKLATRGILVMIPLIAVNGSAGSIRDKMVFFYILIGLMVTGILAERKKKMRTSGVPGIFMLLFLIAVGLAAVLSPYREGVVSGVFDNGIGACYYIAIAIMFYGVSCFYTVTIADFRFMYGTFILLNLFAFLQFFGWDPFQLLRGIAERERSNYLSLIGNTGVYGSYLNLMIPVFVILYLRSSSIWHTLPIDRIGFATALTSGFLGVFVSNCDAVYLGLFFLLPVVMYLVRRESIRFLCEIGMMFCLSGMLFDWLIQSKFGSPRALSSMTVGLVHSVWLLLLTILIFIAWLFCMLPGKGTIRDCKGIANRRAHMIPALVFLMIPILFLTAMVYYSLYNRLVPLNGLEHYLRFSDAWGTGRGFVWRRLITDYLNFPVLNQIFGMGPGSVRLIMREYHLYEMQHRLHYYFDNAHNEYLHYLITLGAFGLLTYLGLMFSAIRHAMGKQNRPASLALASGLFCYLAQAVVGVIQPHVSLFVFLFTAMIVADTE